MQHSESNVKVFSSTDYQRFRMIEGNRPLNEKKIDKIIGDIETGIDVLAYYPILVYESTDTKRGDVLDIADGQHRFYISRKLKRPVYYIVKKEVLHLSENAKVNSNVEKWKTGDFINCYIQLGNKHYEILRDFMDKYGFSATVSVQLLTEGSPDNSGLRDSEGFQRGDFVVKELDKATALADMAIQFKSFKNWKSRGFLVAIHKINSAGKVKISDLADKVNKNIDKLQIQEGWKQYVSNLSDIYNLRRNEIFHII